MGSIDDITLDTILNSMQNIKDRNNLKEIDTEHHKMYLELSHYVMVEPYNVHLLAKNDIIRYVRNSKVSRPSSIVKIVEGDHKNTMCLFLSSVVKRNGVWQIYPSTCVIYRYDRYASDNQTVENIKNIKNMQNVANKTTKYVNVTKEQRAKLLQQAGFSKKDVVLDDKIDDMLDHYAKVKKCTYVDNKTINETNIDTLIDEIFDHEINKKINKKTNNKKITKRE